MGATWCEIHDVSGKIKICSHIDNYVRAKTNNWKSSDPYSDLQEIEAVTILFSQFLLFPEPLLAYCSKCAKQKKLPTGNKMLLLKLLVNFKNLLYLRNIDTYGCAICFYKQIFQIDYDDSEKPLLINKTTKVKISESS